MAEQKAQLQQQFQEAAKMQRENARLQNSLTSLQQARTQQEPQEQAENVAQDSNVPSGDRKMQTLMNIRQLKDIAALQVQRCTCALRMHTSLLDKMDCNINCIQIWSLMTQAGAWPISAGPVSQLSCSS